MVGGATANVGNVRLCYNNFWGSVCDDSWGTYDVNVVCRQLGLETFGNKLMFMSMFELLL